MPIWIHLFSSKLNLGCLIKLAYFASILINWTNWGPWNEQQEKIVTVIRVWTCFGTIAFFLSYLGECRKNPLNLYRNKSFSHHSQHESIQQSGRESYQGKIIGSHWHRVSHGSLSSFHPELVWWKPFPSFQALSVTNVLKWNHSRSYT